MARSMARTRPKRAQGQESSAQQRPAGRERGASMATTPALAAAVKAAVRASSEGAAPGGGAGREAEEGEGRGEGGEADAVVALGAVLGCGGEVYAGDVGAGPSGFAQDRHGIMIAHAGLSKAACR